MIRFVISRLASVIASTIHDGFPVPEPAPDFFILVYIQIHFGCTLSGLQ
jgi:hypothetical protein